MKMETAAETLTTKLKKAIERGFGFKFVRNDPDKEDFDIFRIVNEIFRHMKPRLINKTSTRL